jgi:hypothetical protein
VVDDDNGRSKFFNQGLKSSRVARLKMKLHRQSEIGRLFPKIPQFRLAKRRQPVRRAGMNPQGDDVTALRQLRQLSD